MSNKCWLGSGLIECGFFCKRIFEILIGSSKSKICWGKWCILSDKVGPKLFCEECEDPKFASLFSSEMLVLASHIPSRVCMCLCTHRFIHCSTHVKDSCWSQFFSPWECLGHWGIWPVHCLLGSHLEIMTSISLSRKKDPSFIKEIPME